MADSLFDFDDSQADKLAATQPIGTNGSQTTCIELSNEANLIAADTGGDIMDVDDHSETEEVDYESPETHAIRLIYSYLVEGFVHQVDVLASEFYQEGLIETIDVVGTMGTPCRKRAIQLLQAVMSMIRVASSNFDKFVRVLESHQCFREIVQIMKERYKELVKKQPRQDEQPFEAVSPNFKCPPLTKQPSSIVSVGAEELQIEIDELEKRLESVGKEVGRRKNRKEKELHLTRQEVTQLKQRLDENEKQLAISNFQNKFFQEQLRIAQTQIAQLMRDVVELKQQTPYCGLQCEHYIKCKLFKKDNEKLEDLRLEHIAKIANLNAQIAYLLEGIHLSS